MSGKRKALEKRAYNGKKAAYAGLLLGMLCFLCGCGKTTVNGKVTEIPEPTATSRPTSADTPSPFPTNPPTDVNTPSPFPTNLPTVTEPAKAPTAEPTESPTPAPTMPELPTVAPTEKPSSTPEPTGTPLPTPTEPVTATPTELPLPTSAPTPLPTGTPDYSALIRSGWQRTEDFFGQREVYFSGIFDRAELIASPGRYEYVYTASSEETVRFSVIGEENAEAESFLNVLTERYPDCRIISEGEKDYSYRYTTEGKTVCGRVYVCPQGEQPNRMRMEMVFLPERELSGQEEYSFYLQ